MEYVIDISEVKKTDCSGYPWVKLWPDEIPLVEGEHECDLDVKEGAISEKVLEETWDLVEQHYPATFHEDQTKKPIGFNIASMPEEAVLKKVLSDDEYEVVEFKNE